MRLHGDQVDSHGLTQEYDGYFGGGGDTMFCLVGLISQNSQEAFLLYSESQCGQALSETRSRSRIITAD